MKLSEFTLSDFPVSMFEKLQTAGYPRVEVTEQKIHFAYECCLVNEDVTKTASFR